MLKALCDMGHGDVLILADANFPGETISKECTYSRLLNSPEIDVNTLLKALIARESSQGKFIRCPGVDVNTMLAAIADLFPLDVAYTKHPACVMELTDSDKAKGMATPVAWTGFMDTLGKRYSGLELGKIERFDFYEKAKKASVIIQTGEEKPYGNLLLVKGCVL